MIFNDIEPIWITFISWLLIGVGGSGLMILHLVHNAAWRLGMYVSGFPLPNRTQGQTALAGWWFLSHF